MMTEEKARTKWCPFSRVVETKAEHTIHGSYNVFKRHSSFNRINNDENKLVQEPATNCLGSKCACWEWIDKPNDLGKCGMVGSKVGGQLND